MSYQITIVKRALKELEDLPAKISREIGAAINDLSDNPRPLGSKKLKGEKEYLWRIRIGDYRVIYSINDVIQIVEIRRVAHRGHVYK